MTQTGTCETAITVQPSELTPASQATPPADYTDPACSGRADEPDDIWDMPVLSGQQAALDALRWNWGEAYDIGVDEGEWWCRRKDGKGGTETAATPDALRTMIVTDYTIMPVPREPSPDGAAQ